MTFEQDEPPANGDKTPEVSGPAPDKKTRDGNDAWLKRWLARGKSSKTESEPEARDEELDEGDAQVESDEEATGQPSNHFASAVEEFRTNSPVLLEPREPEEDLDADIVIEGTAAPEPTGFAAKFKAAFLSERTTATFGVVGEMLITGGVIVLLFLAWQLWINNAIVAGKQADAVKAFSNGLTASPSSSAKSTTKPFVKPTTPDYGTPPALESVGQNAVIGNMYAPRLGPGSTRAVANGVTDANATINQGYYGRYEDSQWPGEPGNFAVAVHRNGWGTSFTPAHLIRPGDNFYLETSQGWYVYTVRNTEYVVPTQVDVVNPMPMSEDPPIEGQNIMTITTCSPMNGNGERLIVYGILTSWQPLDAGIPKEITALVEEARS